MMQRVRTEDGVVMYQSDLLRAWGVPHAFSTRIGGISPPPFDSMNLGNPNGCAVQDEEERIQENYRKLHRAVGVEDRPRVWVHQVHGGVVATARKGEKSPIAVKADALVSDDPTRVMAVRVADCVPVLIAGDEGRVVAAVHAGWRGVIAGVVPAAIREMRCPPASLRVAIGPCIGMEAFEVGQEVVEAFVSAFGADAPVKTREDGKGHVDLKRALQVQLSRLGVTHVDVSDRCTVRDRDEFFSHRRDNGVTGRMATIISAAA